MNKLLFCILLVALLSFPAFAGANYPEQEAPWSEYVEGEVFVEIVAPSSSDYPIEDAFVQALLEQAEAFGSKYDLEVGGISPATARASGKNNILFRSKHKSTKELIDELSSDNEVLNITPNGINRYIDSPEKGGGCNVSGSIMLLMLSLLVLRKEKTRG